MDRSQLDELKRSKEALIAALKDAGAQIDGDLNHIRCPWRDDKNGSLSIFQSNEIWFWKDHGSGESGTIVDAVLMTEGVSNGVAVKLAVFKYAQTSGKNCESSRSNGKSKITENLSDLIRDYERKLGLRHVSTHEYQGIEKETSFVTMRFEDADGSKTYRVATRTDSGWKKKRPSDTLPIYNLGSVVETPDAEIIVVEGEKCVDIFREILDSRYVPVTSAFGAKSAKKTDWSPIAGRRIVVWPDMDEEGEAYANDVIQSVLDLGGNPEDLRVVDTEHMASLGLDKGCDIDNYLDYLQRDGLERPEFICHVENLLDLARTPKNNSKSTCKPKSALDIVCLNDVEPREVKWLWHPYVPLGKITILEGDPAAGKTWVALSIASIVSCGKYFPPGEGLRNDEVEPRNVLYMTAEDGLSDTIRPRLDLLGADPKKVHAVRGRTDGKMFSLADVDIIETALVEYTPALIIIDPIQAYLGANVDMYRANEVRPVMAGLAGLAERFDCAIIVIRHFTKATATKAIHQGMGSVDFAAAARSVLICGSCAQDPSERALFQTKNSLERIGEGVGYEIDDRGLMWTGETMLTIGDLRSPETINSESEFDRAKSFLVASLAGGGRPANQVFELATEQRIRKRTLDRAKKKLGVVSVREEDAWYWKFPNGGSEQEDCQGCHM